VPVRRLLETAVAQDPDGVWRQREVTSVARFRVRVVSDRSRSPLHQRGRGEDFELVVDADLGVWVRRFGTDQTLRKDEDATGVSLVVVEDVTAGIRHDVTYQGRPAVDLVRWSCTCGDGCRREIARALAQAQAEAHVREATDRDLAQAQAAERRLEERRRQWERDE
jgi:hypothetical protein